MIRLMNNKITRFYFSSVISVEKFFVCKRFVVSYIILRAIYR